MKVPQVLFSGDHARIGRWRLKKALEKTMDRRPDLLDRILSPEEREIVEEIRKERKEQ
jgi:tRNA (guanine37-N1)-methyltransferase